MTVGSIPTNYPLITPFGSNDWVNFHQGFSSDGFGADVATPVSSGGLRLSRHEMNKFGYEATIGSFLHSIGWQAEWSEEVAANNGGYPKGAVVSVRADRGTSYGLHQYFNTIDNNSSPPAAAENLNADENITDLNTEYNGWKPLFSTQSYNFFPDYNSRTRVGEFIVVPSSPLKRLKVVINEPGWVLVTRTIDNWEDARAASDNLTPSQRLASSQSNFVSLGFWESQADDDWTSIEGGMFSMLFQEGQMASRFMPCNGGIYLSGQCVAPVTSITIQVYRYNMETT